MTPLLGSTGEAGLILMMLQDLVRRLRKKLRRVGAAAFVALGFLAEFGWAFYGSLYLGLGARPAVASEDAARLWLVVAVALAAVLGLAGWLAAPEKKCFD
jgi:hypothetical protein